MSENPWLPRPRLEIETKSGPRLAYFKKVIFFAIDILTINCPL